MSETLAKKVFVIIRTELEKLVLTRFSGDAFLEAITENSDLICNVDNEIVKDFILNDNVGRMLSFATRHNFVVVRET